MDEREAKVTMNKRIEVSATKEFANLFKNSKFQSCKHLLMQCKMKTGNLICK